MKPTNEIIPFDLPSTAAPSIIKVVGVGGGGGNAVSHMYRQGIHDVTFAVANTDYQALLKSPVPTKVQLGDEGLGAGNDPAKGRIAAQASIDKIRDMYADGSRMTFITAGMGGGTGTGAAPIIASTAKSMDILTVGIVTIPFLLEGDVQIDKALDGVEEMSRHVDALLVINNERLRELYGKLPYLQTYARADETLAVAAKSIADIITYSGNQNLDFNDVKSALTDGGVAIMGTGYGEGENRVSDAIEEALNSPLLYNNDISHAKRILFCISFSEESNFIMDELTPVHEYMNKLQDRNFTKFGVYVDPTLGQRIKFTILATGFGVKDVVGENHASARQAIDLQREREQEIARRERRKAYYGKNYESKKKLTPVFLLQQSDLNNGELIAALENTPTYQRTSRQTKELTALRAPLASEATADATPEEITF